MSKYDLRKIWSVNLPATVANKTSQVTKELVDDLILKIWKTINF